MATKALNRRIQEFCSECFENVKFIKDYQELSGKTDKPFDSDYEKDGFNSPQYQVEFVPSTDIIFCNEFHEELEERIKERDSHFPWKSNNNSFDQKIKNLDKVESTVHL